MQHLTIKKLQTQPGNHKSQSGNKNIIKNSNIYFCKNLNINNNQRAKNQISPNWNHPLFYTNRSFDNSRELFPNSSIMTSMSNFDNIFFSIDIRRRDSRRS